MAIQRVMTRQFPATRLRRTRSNAVLNHMLCETQLSAAHLIYPVFIIAGSNATQAVPSMPGVERMTADVLVERMHAWLALGLRCFALFPVIDLAHKSLDGREAWNDNGLVATTIKLVKQHHPDACIISDVALDPYTTHGQDGIVDANHYVVNDLTVDALVKQALCHARAGADIVAPSDMMDGRIGCIRNALEQAGLVNTCIMSYAAKYASAYYGPFRDAVGSAAQLKGASKSSYQMHPGNINEALHEVAMDIQEGADMVIVKPGMPYLDVAKAVKDQFGVPTFAYQVSGEYSMHQAAISAGWLDEQVILESLLAFRRAGCDGIWTYFAPQAAAMLKQKSV